MLSHLILPVFVLFAWPRSVASESDITYCSSVNTGALNDPNVSTFQSNGLCTDHCKNKWAFGILQGKKCWCSNIAPNKATNVDDKKCNTGCPGYPDDSCGDAAKGLFAYLEMSGQMPSGTATVPAPKSTNGKETSSKSDSSTNTAPGPATTGSTVETSVGGEITTIIVPNSQTNPTSTPDTSKKGDDSGMSGGTVAGVVVGSVGGCAAIGAVIVMFIFAKRRSRAASPDPSVQNILLDGRTSKGSQMSFMKGMFSDNHSHTLSAGSTITPARMPGFTDNRMKTDTVLWPGGRRDSSLSLQDNEDYSRPVLRLTNPD
ncbi:WSC domain-containing protein [Aspergillus tanneri]|uniref:WSC domain-containing protein n=1 Tax=Aspergillus tanneri TaxID=1220188 RepID=A0A5M9MQ64_9EURO|nr:uncharacterized protein ATNIH1004_005776 [Aspergillus tanneri]KAA8647093.1 hypothetical protein ATNIH1004_005776 [Aspergillus tanneri]